MEKPDTPSSEETPSSLEQSSNAAENKHELNEQTRYVPRAKVITVRTISPPSRYLEKRRAETNSI